MPAQDNDQLKGFLPNLRTWAVVFPVRGWAAYYLESGHLGEVEAYSVWTLFHGPDMKPVQDGRRHSSSK